MASALVVVESPAKAKTLNRYLGKDYRVLASYGHVRDLRPKSGAVEPDNDFAMHYEAIDKSARHVAEIRKALRSAAALYLATDPDREGEAIAWHLCELLRSGGHLKSKPVHRVVFHEITKAAVQDAFHHPRELADALVDAQQARRALDYLVGFHLSPLLWKKLRPGLSAGRVQSPALRMIVERESEITAFKPREYWTLDANARKDQDAFPCRLVVYEGDKLEQFSITGGERATEIRTALLKHAGADGGLPGELTVADVRKKRRRRNPAAPFITSTLQQEAVRKLGMTTQQTMRTAQQLYEGVDVGEGVAGLITYMRTDSVTLARSAIEEIRALIRARYGAEAVPAQPRTYRTRTRNAQEAHEAIRPVSVERTPEQLRGVLERQQFRLYELIWKRAVASQMASAQIDTVTVDLACGEGNLLRATGSTVAVPGFLAVYEEGVDDAAGKGDEEGRVLPPLQAGDRVELLALEANQHFTTPPPRYTEASLVRMLEQYGIGRPSTYAGIISTLKAREYVEMPDRKRFVPTEIGSVVSGFLTAHFEQYVDYEFTARLEDELDAISRGEKQWIPVMRRFWEGFAHRVREKHDKVSRSEACSVRELGRDPASGEPVYARMGRFGPCVQLGEGGGDGADRKPRFAGLLPHQRLDAVTLEEALELLRFPRALGADADGEEIRVHLGRYGPYLRCGKLSASLEDSDDPATIALERARELLEARRKAGNGAGTIKVFEEHGITVRKGRYGPYVTDGQKNASLPKGQDPGEISLERGARVTGQEEGDAQAPHRRPQNYPQGEAFMSTTSFVAILLGSESDLGVMQAAADVLQRLDVAHELRICSAHRTPADLDRYITAAEPRGCRIYIAAAGLAAHLAGGVAARTTRPVIGVPLAAGSLGGLDALLSTVQMPGGIPVACTAIGKPGAVNAALLAAQILALDDADLEQRLRAERAAGADKVRAADQRVGIRLPA